MSCQEKAITRQAILLSRGITRSGDHAWDLALPLTIVGLFPATLLYVSAYFIAMRLLSSLMVSYFGQRIDSASLKKYLKIALGFQSIGILAVALIISAIGAIPPAERASLLTQVLFAALIVAGALAKSGYSLMNVNISYKWIPKLFEGNGLVKINSQIIRVDFAMEIAAPLVAGLVLLGGSNEGYILGGFLWIVIWNLMSFIFEGIILSWLYNNTKNLQEVLPVTNASSRKFSMKFIDVKLILQQPMWPVILGYTFLWITVLTPQHALLTAFLKAEWKIDEFSIGLFRAGGALAGIIATLAFDRITRIAKIPLVTALFISLQAVSLIVCSAGFQRSSSAFYFVVICILVSRIGLYGFILGDTNLRQTTIPESIRGAVNSAATSLNELAGLVLYVVGLVFWAPESFAILAWLSAISVTIGAILTLTWSLQSGELRNRA